MEFLIPKIEYGEYLVDKNTCIKVTVDALNLGCTHIDTAQIYLNEQEVD